MRTPLFLRCLAGCIAAASSSLWAAGGHHAVDDAAILEPGQCEVESWFSRAGDGERLLHLGGGCRVGPVEIGLAGEYARLPGGSQTGWGAQVKWATPLADGLAAGVALSLAWAAHVRPRYQGTSLVGLLTWMPREDVGLHLNLGRDFLHRGRDESRWGASAEWMFRTGWQATLERYRDSQSHFVRAGLRWAGGENWSVDLSRAHRLSGPGVSNWTLGATWLAERR